MVDYSWDKGNDESKRLLLKSRLTNEDVEVQFQVMKYQGALTASLLPHGGVVEVNYNMHSLKVKYQLK